LLARSRRLDQPSIDEITDGRLRDSNMAADTNEPNPAFSDQTAREPLTSTQQLGDLSYSQQPLHA
jgi:hypothetical protein